MCTTWVSAQEMHTLVLSAQGASTYPTRLAYEVLNEKGTSLTAGYVDLLSDKDKKEVRLALPEKFALQVYEDANRNGTMDLGFFRQPLEKYAFSNQAWAILAKPDLEEMLVPRQGDRTEVTLVLKKVTDL